MKRLIQLIILLLGLFSLDKTSAQYQFNSERILEFHSDLVIDSLSKLTVTEKIQVNCLRLQISRGIYRALPTQRNIQEKTFYVHYKILSVKRDGKEEPFHTARENGNFVIYIGDADVYLKQGVYTYEITYKTKNQIGFFEDFDELYWNVNGTYWVFPVDKISATVHLPDGSQITQQSCYTGAYGSAKTNCKAEVLSDNTLKWSAQKLGPNEGLTIAVGIAKGTLKEPELPFYLKTDNLIKIILGILGALLGFYGIQWYRYGRDPEKPTVVPQFNPPRGLSPASIGYLNSGNYSHKFITATFVHLAVKGYLKIKEYKENYALGIIKLREYTIYKLNPPSQFLHNEELAILRGISGNSLKLNGNYDPKVSSIVSTFKDRVQKNHKHLIEKGDNRKKVILPLLLISLIYFALLITSYMNLYNLSKLIVGCIIYFVALAIYGSIYTYPTLRYKGFWFWLIPTLPLLIFGAYWYFNQEMEPFNLGLAFLLVGLFILTIFKYLIERPDKELMKLKSEIEGFKMYLAAAENQLLKFHNPPKLTPELFESMLPYAIVLGVDDIWGEKFENLLKKMGTPYENSWYQGSTPHFTKSLTSNLGSNFTSSITSSSTAPSSSSSGSGGGGFSGGGGGGGGGGGW